GYAFSGTWVGLHLFGMYGIGFLTASCAAFFLIGRRFAYAGIGFAALLTLTTLPPDKPYRTDSKLHLAGVQMEFPVEADIPRALDVLLAEHTNADILVLSEYTLLSSEYNNGS